MRTNSLKTMLQGGENALGGWCALSDSMAAEIVANLDLDYVVVDMQHGVTGYSDLIPMLQAIHGKNVTPLVRIPCGDFGLAQRALDAGAEGIIVPFVETVADASDAVRACRYPPEGTRSYGPIRARMHLGSDPVLVNGQVLCLVQVETANAFDNLDEIIGYPGVDGVYVGPADLALAFGLAVGDQHPKMERLLLTVASQCRTAGLIAGIHTFSGEAAARAIERGFTMVTVGSDATWLRSGYERELAVARRETAEPIVGFY